MMKSFEGKRVLVTGGSRGIGRATVEAFLRRRRAGRGQRTHCGINGRGHRCHG